VDNTLGEVDNFSATLISIHC